MARRRAKPLALASAHRLTASWRLSYTTVGWRVAFVVCESRPGLAASRRLAHTTVGWRASLFASTGCATADAMLATRPYYGEVARHFCGLEKGSCRQLPYTTARWRAQSLALAVAHWLTAFWQLDHTTIGSRISFVVEASRRGLASSRRLAHTTVGWRACLASSSCSPADVVLATRLYYGQAAHQASGTRRRSPADSVLATRLYYNRVAPHLCGS